MESGADFTVQVVSSGENLRVQKVARFPDSCGQWQFVSQFPDLKVRFVTGPADFKIRYVPRFPGLT